MAETSGKRNVVYCRQQDLAFTFGLSRVSIGKSLKKLQDDGLIELGYGCIHFPDPAKLEHWLSKYQEIEPLTANWQGPG